MFPVTPAEGQVLFDGVVSIVLTAYGIGVVVGAVIWLFKQAGKSF